MNEAKDTPTRDKVDRLAQSCDLAKVALASNDSFSIGQSILHECSYTLRALSAALERAERERDELDLGDSWAALLIAERTKTAQAERERDEAREALEKVKREAWVSGMVNAANIIGRMKVEDRKQWVVLDAAQDLIRAAIKGDDT